MSCQVTRVKGQIAEVKAPNMEKSMAYESILKTVESTTNKQILQNKFQSWVGKHIKNTTDNKELALALYKQLYSPMFKQWFGQWQKISQAISHQNDVKGFYSYIFGQNPQQALYEAAVQANSSADEREGAIRTFGEPIVKIALELFPTAKVGESYNSVVGKTDINGEPLLTNETYTNANGDKRNILNQPSSNPQYQLTGSSLETIPSRASTKTIALIKEFLNRIGVKLEPVTSIIVDGQKITSNGLADAMNRLVQVVVGKQDVALTEEAFHIAVEVIAQKDPALFKEMMNKIGRYNMYDKVLQTYGTTYVTVEGKPDINRIKKETIAKVLAEMFIRNNDQVTEKPEFLDQTRTWWQKVVDWLRKKFLKTGKDVFKEDPFDMALGVIKDKNITGYDESQVEEGQFFAKTTESVGDKILRLDKVISEDQDGNFEVNGVKVKSVEEVLAKEDEAKAKVKSEANTPERFKANREFKKATEGKIKTDIHDIFHRYINADGNLREEPLAKTNPSAIDPNHDDFYRALESNMKDRLEQYRTNDAINGTTTKFYTGVNIYSEKSKIATNVDFIAVNDKGKVDVIQFRTPEMKRADSDIPYNTQSLYNKEMEEIRRILETGYGVKKADFNHTRTIPVVANYGKTTIGTPIAIREMRIGNANPQLISDDILLPIPSASETTGNTLFDELISKLRGLLQKVADESRRNTKNINYIERANTIDALLRSIKKLQIQKSTEALISSAKIINKRQEVKLEKLTKVVANIDPYKTTDAEMGKIANEILEDFSEAEIYAHMDDALASVFKEKTEENAKILSDAATIAQTSRVLSKEFQDLSEKLQTQKYAVKSKIHDEFKPEKNLTWYRRNIRSLSQSSSTAGKLLWNLQKPINQQFHILFAQKLEEMKVIKKEADKWLEGKTLNDMMKIIFTHDAKGNKTGSVWKKYAKKFYDDIYEAQQQEDDLWVRNNIDMVAYQAWYDQAYLDKQEEVKGIVYSVDEEEQKKRSFNELNNWINKFDPEGDFVNRSNYMLKDFPLDKHFSAEYERLRKPENAAMLKVYNVWRGKLERSYKNGMIDEHNGWSWFPNVKRNMIEKLTWNKAGSKFQDFLFGDILVDVDDNDFGRLNPITNEPINEIHANYVHDLVVRGKDTNGEYWEDASAKSFDIFNVMSLWDRETLKYELKTDMEGLAKMLLFNEEHKKRLLTKPSGKLIKKPSGEFATDDNNEVNASYLREHIEAMLYGKNLTGASSFTMELPVKSWAEKLNKLAGRKVVEVPTKETITISGVKALGFLNRWMVFKTLGVNVLSPIANLFGGTFNVYLNQGQHFTKKDFTEAQIDYTASRFYDTEKHKKLAGFLAYIQPYTEDNTIQATKNLSVSKATQLFSSDHLMFMMRASDKGVNMHIAIAFIKNEMVRNGEILNIREVVREELGRDKKYTFDSNGKLIVQNTKEWNAAFEKRVEELKSSPEALLNIMSIKDDKLVIPGIDLYGKTVPQSVQDLRNLMIQTAQNALGNTSREDLSLYKRNMMYQSISMFKNWIPRMIDVRGQSLRYNAGTNQYEWGRMRMLGDALHQNVLSTIAGLFKSLGGNDTTLIETARRSYEAMAEKRAAQQEDFDITESEYIDMYVKGISTQFKELGFSIAAISLLIAARLESPDRGDDPTLKGGYKWMLRGLDKLTDEITFFYAPQSFADIVNGSIFPAASLLLDAQRFFTSAMAKGFYEYILGDDQRAGKQHPAKYAFRMFPITKELLNYMAIMQTDLAKQWDLRTSSRNGSSR